SIAEDFISSGWFIRRYYEATGRKVAGVKELVAGYENEAIIRLLFVEFGKNLGTFINTFIEMQHPKLIIVGGNISNAWSLFEIEMKSQIYSHHPGIDIRKSVHGENAALIGAVGSWFTKQSGVAL
ncbi:MAG: ROK family protein, partial [Chitinophagaceae bacterium]